MIRFGAIVMSVKDAQRAAEFWTNALGYVRRDDSAGGGSPVLVSRVGTGPTIVLDEDDRTHLDLVAANRDEQQAEIERLLSLGARRVDWTYPDDADFVVLEDTEGNLFCIVNADKG